MRIINNQQEYEEFYPYENKAGIKQYPKEYPCVCTYEQEGGGLMGEYWQMYVAYYPKNVSVEEAFLLGLKRKFEPLINK
jgi:hypothetical protein